VGQVNAPTIAGGHQAGLKCAWWRRLPSRLDRAYISGWL